MNYIVNLCIVSDLYHTDSFDLISFHAVGITMPINAIFSNNKWRWSIYLIWLYSTNRYTEKTNWHDIWVKTSSWYVLANFYRKWKFLWTYGKGERYDMGNMKTCQEMIQTHLTNTNTYEQKWSKNQLHLFVKLYITIARKISCFPCHSSLETHTSRKLLYYEV